MKKNLASRMYCLSLIITENSERERQRFSPNLYSLKSCTQKKKVRKPASTGWRQQAPQVHCELVHVEGYYGSNVKCIGAKEVKMGRWIFVYTNDGRVCMKRGTDTKRLKWKKMKHVSRGGGDEFAGNCEGLKMTLCSGVRRRSRV